MRPCTVCEHPDLDSINQALALAQPYPVIAERHGLSRDAVRRHNNNHAPLDVVPLHVARRAPESVLEKGRRVGDKLDKLLDAAFRAGKGSQVVTLARTRLQYLELEAKLTGELRDGSGPQVAVNLAADPQFRSLLVGVLAKLEAEHPQALEAVGSVVQAVLEP